jgi:hypothetical protein
MGAFIPFVNIHDCFMNHASPSPDSHTPKDFLIALKSGVPQPVAASHPFFAGNPDLRRGTVSHEFSESGVQAGGTYVSQPATLPTVMSL